MKVTYVFMFCAMALHCKAQFKEVTKYSNRTEIIIKTPDLKISRYIEINNSSKDTIKDLNYNDKLELDGKQMIDGEVDIFENGIPTEIKSWMPITKFVESPTLSRNPFIFKAVMVGDYNNCKIEVYEKKKSYWTIYDEHDWMRKYEFMSFGLHPAIFNGYYKIGEVEIINSEIHAVKIYQSESFTSFIFTDSTIEKAELYTWKPIIGGVSVQSRVLEHSIRYSMKGNQSWLRTSRIIDENLFECDYVIYEQRRYRNSKKCVNSLRLEKKKFDVLKNEGEFITTSKSLDMTNYLVTDYNSLINVLDQIF